MNQLIKKDTDLENKTFQGEYLSSNLDHNVMQRYTLKST